MSSLAISTVVSPDKYAGFIPLFVYTASRVGFVQLYLRGPMPPYVQEALKHVNSKNYNIVENAFKEYPNRVSVCNCLRYLVPEDDFSKFKYVYVTDVDFLMFPHKPTMERYYQKRMAESRGCFQTFRGTIRRPFRPRIGLWENKFTRLAGGTVMLKHDWFKKTKAARNYYRHILKHGDHDDMDKIPSCSYREYDEVMLFRICLKSGLQTPTKRRVLVGGSRYNIEYRDIHLGDFDRKRIGKAKLRRMFLHAKNKAAFKLLEKEPKWQKCCEVVCENNKYVCDLLGKLRKYG